MCGVVGIGVDLVDVAGFQRLIESDRGGFVSSVWTDIEKQDAEGSIERLAARWSAKEAVMKALGRGLGDVDPFDVEIVSVSSGALEVRLHGSAKAAAALAGAGCVHVSISHQGGWAIAFAVASAQGLENQPGSQ